MCFEKYLRIENIKKIHNIVLNLQSNMSGTKNTEIAIHVHFWIEINAKL